MTALAAVGLTIGTFLEVDCATDSKDTKDAPLLTYTTDKDPFLVFPCTVTKDTDTTTGYSTVSRTKILRHYDSKRATLQFFSSLPIQPRYILDGSTCSSQGDTIVAAVHSKVGTLAVLALCDTGATLNLCNQQLANALLNIGAMRLTGTRKATHIMGIRYHEGPKSYQEALILLSLTPNRPLVLKVVIMDNMVHSMPLILACRGFNNRLVCACGLTKLSTSSGRDVMYCSKFPEPDLCPILTPQEIRKF